LAVAAHGYVRATDDVDFACPANAKEVQARLGGAGIQSAIRRGDSLAGDIQSVVYGTVDGVRFDVILPPVPIDWGRGVELTIEKGRPPLRVVDLDALIRLKLRAGGPQDLIDVVQLVRRHPEAQPKALAVAEAHGLRGRLEAWLADPRIRSPEEPPPLAPLPTRRVTKTSPRAAARGRGRRRADR
jgi:hypothetical protein